MVFLHEEIKKNNFMELKTKKKDFTLFSVYRVLKKAEKGETVTVAFLGGSVTQGSLASSPENCYAARTCSRLRERFPRADIRYVNAGVGATGSLIGAHRLEQDVVSHRPDLVFVEFAVNDKNTPDDREAYESVLVRLLGRPEPPAVIALFMGREDGSCEQEQQKAVCRHYRLPVLSVRDAVQNGIKSGAFHWEDLYADDVHPNDEGHRMIARWIAGFLESVLLGEEPESGPGRLREDRLYGDCFRNGRILDATGLIPSRTGGFEPYEEEFQCFRRGWIGSGNELSGTPFTAEIEGRNIYLVYRRSISPFYGKAMAGLSGGPYTELNGLFRSGWGDYAEICMLARGSERKKYAVEVRRLSGIFVVFGFLVS